MSKLWVFISVVIFATAFMGCQEKEKIADTQEAAVEQAAVTEQPEVSEDQNVSQETTATESDAVAEEPVAKEAPAEETVTEEPAPAVAEESTAEQASPAAAAQETMVEPMDQGADTVAVTVNGQEITEEEINTELGKRVEIMKKGMPEGAGADIPQDRLQQMRLRVLDMKVEQALLSQELKKNNLSVSDEQVLEEVKKIAGRSGKTLEEVKEEIAKMGMTLEDITGQIRMQMETRALMEALDPDAVVSEDDIKKFYDGNPQYFNKPEQVKASHILCGKRGIKEEEYPAELEKIKAAQARLQAGESFEDVAKDVSTCPSASGGGDLGFFGKGQMDPAFEKTAFGLEVGQTSDIVKTSFGYHIIKVTDKKEASKVSFEEAKDQIKDFLTQQKQRESWGAYNKTMHDNAEIKYSEKEQALRDEAQKAAEAARKARMPKMPPAPPAPQPEATENK